MESRIVTSGRLDPTDSCRVDGIPGCHNNYEGGAERNDNSAMTEVTASEDVVQPLVFTSWKQSRSSKDDDDDDDEWEQETALSSSRIVKDVNTQNGRSFKILHAHEETTIRSNTETKKRDYAEQYHTSDDYDEIPATVESPSAISSSGSESENEYKLSIQSASFDDDDDANECDLTVSCNNHHRHRHHQVVVSTAEVETFLLSKDGTNPTSNWDQHDDDITVVMSNVSPHQQKRAVPRPRPNNNDPLQVRALDLGETSTLEVETTHLQEILRKLPTSDHRAILTQLMIMTNARGQASRIQLALRIKDVIQANAEKLHINKETTDKAIQLLFHLARLRKSYRLLFGKSIFKAMSKLHISNATSSGQDSNNGSAKPNRSTKSSKNENRQRTTTTRIHGGSSATRLLRVSSFCRGFPHEDARRVEGLTVVPMPRRKRTDANDDKGDDSCATWVRVPVSIGAALSLQEADLAWLAHPSSLPNCRVAVRLMLDPWPENEPVTSCADEGNSSGGHALPASTTIFVAPVVLANLGISPHCFVEDRFPMDGFTLENVQNKPSIAQKVLLRPLGRTPLPLRELLLRQRDSDGRSSSGANESDDNRDSWAFPARSSSVVLQKSFLISVEDRRRDEIFHYHVESIIEEHGADFVTSSTVFVSSPATEYEIDSTQISRVAVRRLPPLSLPSNVPPHPNWKIVAKSLMQSPLGMGASLTHSRIATRILHVMGTDAEHHVSCCIETAAHMTGLQCFTVKGLAAFAHNQGHVVRTGSLVDRLVGLEAAFRHIRQRRMEPCVFHLCRIDQELSSMDDQLQHDEEDRFWGKFIEELGGSGMISSDLKENNRHDLQRTPPLLLVLSTASPLKPGPFLEGLVLPTIHMSVPDDDYIRYLWDKECNGDDLDEIPVRDDIMNVLRGRTVQEIVQLGRQMGKGDHNVTAERLEDLCQKADCNRRAESSDVSQISKVHWEDIGGLAHVRAEIMDAIELPLKYPQLFPKSRGGRSGILLFGAPGTGKTLVAKAVATECRLPFLSVKGPELLGSYVGESEANIRKIFASARQAASTNLPTAAAVLFFDELDSLAPRRGGVDHGGGVMERVVASLLAELDGPTTEVSEDAGRVFVLGATNRPDLLDPSLLRPGRLDRLVYLGVPADDEERAKLLASQLRKMKLDGDAYTLSCQVVSLLPPRLSGADFSKLSSGAMLRAVRRLCDDAERESHTTVGSASGRKQVAIDQILEGWGPAKCTPTITLEDLLEAAKDVSPSVSAEEIARYERLRAEHDTKRQ